MRAQGEDHRRADAGVQPDEETGARGDEGKRGSHQREAPPGKRWRPSPRRSARRSFARKKEQDSVYREHLVALMEKDQEDESERDRLVEEQQAKYEAGRPG